MTSHASRGLHLIADLHGIAPAVLTDAAAIEHLLRQGALDAGATIVGAHFHTFGAGMGVTGVVMLAESHISIHTWPETGLAAVDIFMCGSARPDAALDAIVGALAPASQTVQRIQRGG